MSRSHVGCARTIDVPQEDAAFEVCSRTAGLVCQHATAAPAPAPGVDLQRRRLLDALQAKVNALYGHHREPSKHVIEFRSGDISSFWLLHTVSSACAPLSHRAKDDPKYQISDEKWKKRFTLQKKKNHFEELPFGPCWLGRLRQRLDNDPVFREAGKFFTTRPVWTSESGYGQHVAAAYSAHRYCQIHVSQ